MTDKPLDILNVQVNLAQVQVLDVLDEELVLAKADSIRGKRIEDQGIIQGEIQHMTRAVKLIPPGVN